MSQMREKQSSYRGRSSSTARDAEESSFSIARLGKAFFFLPLGGSNRTMPVSRVMVLWILLITGLNAAGWILSAFDALTVPGYFVFLAVIGFVLAQTWKGFQSPPFRSALICWGRIRMRFSRPFAFAFLVLMGFAFLGGVLYLPSNYDALAYRVPRIFNWLEAGHWHWIHTEFHRLNTRGLAWEWIAAPLLLFTQSFRGLFLINFVCFAFLPGLTYSTFVRLGVRPRVAWHWMWILPCGYCFLLQAASIGNELPGVFLAIAAWNFALRAQVSRRLSEVWLSCLCAALLSNAKAANLPLLLPWAIAILPVVRLLLRRPIASVGIVLLGGLVSTLPLVAANLKFSGDPFGRKIETKGDAFMEESRFHIPINSVMLITQNFVPPVFPLAEKWNAWTIAQLSPELKKVLKHSLEAGSGWLAVQLMSNEEGAGIGFGISCLLVFTIGGVLILKRKKAELEVSNDGRNYLLLLAPWIAFIVFLQLSNLSAIARILAPYYLLLFPLLLVGKTHERLILCKGWRWAALATFVLALVPLTIMPARPLWPAQTVCEALKNVYPLAAKMETIYRTYRKRAATFSPVAAYLPKGEKTLGIVTFDDPESSLWMPWGTRKIIHITSGDRLEDLRRKGVEYIIVSPFSVKGFELKPQDWIEKMRLVRVTKIPLLVKAGRGYEEWDLVKLPPSEVILPNE